MAVLFMVRYNIPNQKVPEYLEWIQKTIPKLLAVPGLVEFSAYRAGAATRYVLLIFKIESEEAFSKFWEYLQKTRLMDELYANAVDVVTELWGPSPFIPEPLRPPR